MYARRSGEFKVHKIRGDNSTACGQQVKNHHKWVEVDEDEWTIRPCMDCQKR